MNKYLYGMVFCFQALSACEADVQMKERHADDGGTVSPFSDKQIAVAAKVWSEEIARERSFNFECSGGEVGWLAAQAKILKVKNASGNLPIVVVQALKEIKKKKRLKRLGTTGKHTEGFQHKEGTKRGRRSSSLSEIETASIEKKMKTAKMEEK
jgi:hypothetical protein